MTGRHSAFTAAGLMIGGALLAKGLRSRRALDLDGRVVLITGGSRGLGLLLAREIGGQGARVIVVARDEAELERAQQDLEARGIAASTIVADVATAAEAQRIVVDVLARYGRLDVLINNAGVISVGPLEHMTVGDFEESLSVHFWGPFHAMRAAIPHMREAGGGRIVNISSIGGKVGVPHLASYCTGKFALTGFSTAARAELACDGVLVTTVSPGLMRTGSPFNAWFKGQYRQEFTWFAIADSLPVLSIEGRRAARQIVDALRHGDAELVVSWPARLAIAASAVAPNMIGWAMGFANRLLPSSTNGVGSNPHSGW
jgi:NAD(P)-dependent dehydrogenase (short-subunit alcohol dehydrogenase family)